MPREAPDATAIPLTQEEEAAEINRLSKLNRLAYEKERDAAAARLGIRVGVLDQEVESKRAPVDELADTEGQGRALELREREPWPEPVNGPELLAEIIAALRQYIVVPQESAEAIATWVLASYVAPAFFIFARLSIESPVRRCGKSTLLDVLEALVNRPLVTSNIHAAALFRTIEAAHPGTKTPMKPIFTWARTWTCARSSTAVTRKMAPQYVASVMMRSREHFQLLHQ